MIPSTRVRVTRPPADRLYLASKEGRIVKLVPVAQSPLEYTVLLGATSGEVVQLPSTSLSILDYEDNADDEEEESNSLAMERMLIVNSLCYCEKHRLESCGDCCFDFRVMNLMQELGGDVDAAMKLDEELKGIMFKIRQAPNKNLVTLPFDLYYPIIHEDILCGVEPNTNIAQLADFPRDKPLLNAFESQFVLDMHTGATEEKTNVRPLNRVRLIMSDVGWHLDRALEQRISNPKIMLQNASCSEGLSFDILATKIIIKDFQPGVLWRLPVVVVAYARSFAGNFDVLLNTLQPGQFMSENIAAESHEMELLVGIMEANAKRMDTSSMESFRSKLVDPRQRVGVIVPIRTEAQERYYQHIGDHCNVCTASQCKLLQCGKCKAIQYCCLQCQKLDWKKHKRVCRPHAD